MWHPLLLQGTDWVFALPVCMPADSKDGSACRKRETGSLVWMYWKQRQDKLHGYSFSVSVELYIMRCDSREGRATVLRNSSVSRDHEFLCFEVSMLATAGSSWPVLICNDERNGPLVPLMSRLTFCCHCKF